MTEGCRSATSTVAGRRAENEDGVRAFSSSHVAGIAIADGMGGHQGGAVASGLIIEALAAAWPRLPAEPLNELQQAIRRVNQEILDRAKADAGLAGMGSTLAMAVTDGRRFWVLHVGDSRVFLIARNQIERLTRDHSVVEDAIDKGLMGPAEAATHPYRHALLRCIGHDEDPEATVCGPCTVGGGCILLACSDGLSGSVSEWEMLEAVERNRDLTAAGEYLVRLAYHKGSDDNISVALLEIGRFERRQGELMRLPPIPHSKALRGPRGTKTLLVPAVALFLILCALLVALARTGGGDAGPSETRKTDTKAKR